MTELMRKAWLGWAEYTDHGKLAALLLASLLFLWFGRKKAEQRTLRLYATVMTVCCIFPPGAAVLMAYQTKFYDYMWIWSLVPMTAVTAWGIVLALEGLWPDFRPGQWRRGLPAGAILLGAVLLCGSLGRPVWSDKGQAAERSHAYSVLDELEEVWQEERLCLWAPQRIMEYAREANPEILLPYGRNMWDTSLNGYAYDVYDENIVEMYLWMEGLEGTSLRASGNEAGAEDWTEGRMPEDRTPEGGEPEDPVPEAAAASGGSADTVYAPKVYGGYAVDAGVTCILLPEGTEQGILRELEKTLQVEARKLEGYWMLYGWTD